MATDRLPIKLERIRKHLRFIERYPVHDYLRQSTKLQELISEEKLQETLKELNSIFPEGEKSKYVAFKTVEKIKKKFLFFGKDRERIKIALAPSEIGENFYLELSRADNTNGKIYWSANLVLENLKISIKDNKDLYSLNLTAPLLKTSDDWRYSIQIRNCEIVCDTRDRIAGDLTLCFRGFYRVHLIENKSWESITFKFIDNHILSDKEPISISKNHFKWLSVSFEEPPEPMKAFYRQINFEDNVVFHTLLVHTSDYDEIQRLTFLFRKNAIGTLSLWYVLNDFEDAPSEIKPDMLRYNHWPINREPTGHSLDMATENVIDAIQIVGRYPNILGFGVNEYIGDDILRQFAEDAKTDREGARNNAKLMVETNRGVLGSFKKIAIDESRKVIEQAMNYHISKLDRMLLIIDGGFWLDRLLSWAGWELSRHGASWLRPIVWIIGSALFFAAIITWALGKEGLEVGLFLADGINARPEELRRDFALFGLSMTTLVMAGVVFGASLFFLYAYHGSGIKWLNSLAYAHYYSGVVIAVFWDYVEELIELGSHLDSLLALLLGMWVAGVIVFGACNVSRMKIGVVQVGFVIAIYSSIVGAVLKTAVGDAGDLYRAVLLELMNPLGSPKNVIESPFVADGLIWGYSFPIFTTVFFSYKALYAICIFMFYRAAARFIIK